MSSIIRKVSAGKPTDKGKWETLCLQSGNLQQSTLFDPVQLWFHQLPVYIEVWEKEALCGGVKLFTYTPSRLPRISRQFGKYCLQAGECLVSQGMEDYRAVLKEIQGGLNPYLAEESPVYFRHYGYYDQPEYLLQPPGKIQAEVFSFGNAYLDLYQGESKIWENIHPHHKRKIHTAQKLGYRVERVYDIELFLAFLRTNYQDQKNPGPDPEFIRHFYKVMQQEEITRIFVAYKGTEAVAAVLNTFYGPVVTYAFGGSHKQNEGAAHLLHYQLIQESLQEGYGKYYFGQVAVNRDQGDNKFITGISPFKRRFGTKEITNYRRTFVFKPIRHFLWKTATSLTGRR